jgi:citrate lyase beta subunit
MSNNGQFSEQPRLPFLRSGDLGGRRVRSPWNSRAEIGPFGDFSDAEGYLAATKRAAVLGYEGKWAIHPSQIELANHVFTPSKAEVTKARRILEAMDQAAKNERARCPSTAG